MQASEPRGGPAPASSAPRRPTYQIGDIVERTKLSLRTVRYYEEAGLLTPVARTTGGFRLYDDDTLDRLAVIKRMKPLGFTLEEMRVLLSLRDELTDAALEPEKRERLMEQLAAWTALADEKLKALQEQTSVAETFVAGLRADGERLSPP